MTQIQTVPVEHLLFQQAAELYLQDEHTLTIGSVGRAAVMGVGVDPYRPTGVQRDIDIVRMGERPTPEVPDPNVDYLFENWIAPDGSHLVFPHDPSVQVALKHPEVFEPHIRTVGDFQVRTPHHDVLGKIGTMQFIQRPKDIVAAKNYDDFLSTKEDHLPKELLQPFDDFRNILSQRRGYRARAVARNMYHVAVPEKTRKELNLGEKINWLRK